MIKIKVTEKNISILGHANYDEYGKDIVCSAVSTLMETLANGLTEVVKANVNIVVDENIPHLSVTLMENDKEKFKVAHRKDAQYRYLFREHNYQPDVRNSASRNFAAMLSRAMQFCCDAVSRDD